MSTISSPLDLDERVLAALDDDEPFDVATLALSPVDELEDEDQAAVQAMAQLTKAGGLWMGGFKSSQPLANDQIATLFHDVTDTVKFPSTSAERWRIAQTLIATLLLAFAISYLARQWNDASALTLQSRQPAMMAG